MWYKGHRGRSSLKTVFAGVVGCEVDRGDRVGSEVKGQDCSGRVKLSKFRDFKIPISHIQRRRTKLLDMA